jgi:hypothetical protein
MTIGGAVTLHKTQNRRRTHGFYIQRHSLCLVFARRGQRVDPMDKLGSATQWFEMFVRVLDHPWHLRWPEQQR